MATTYYYRLFELEFGPVPFQELVQLVRSGRLEADDLVRADWQQHWQASAELVGLFHMAGRAEALAQWELEQAARQTAVATQPDPVSTLGVSATPTDPSSGWQKRLAEPRGRESPEPQAHESETPPTESVAELVAQASLAADQKQVRHHRAVSPQGALLRACFRWGGLFSCANLTGLAIASWSHTEELRFPQAGFSPMIFPIWGPCSSPMYLFFMLDAMLLAGLSGYFIAGQIEDRLES